MAVLGDLSDRDGEIILLDALAHSKNGAAEFNRMHKAMCKGGFADAAVKKKRSLRARLQQNCV